MKVFAMAGNFNWLYRLITYLTIVFFSPLLGTWFSDQPILALLRFPPRPLQPYPISFSWTVFILLTGFLSICLVLIIFKINRYGKRLSRTTAVKLPFPGWGRLGIVLMILFWLLAWNRFEWFKAFQPYTFTPLWLSYILIVNALSYQRTRHCLLLDHAKKYLFLFFISAILWWSFEYLNLYVRNWYYVGVDDLSQFNYFIYATLPFATVLPAVLGTRELLQSFPIISAGLDTFKPLAIQNKKNFSFICLVIAIIGFITLAIWPDKLFFLTWLMPVSLVLGLHALAATPALLQGVEGGDWRQVWTFSIAGLICGFFWEMWNFYSFAHWVYSVPFVQHAKIFAMPVLGYAGYLPFGLFCGLFSDFICHFSKKMYNV